MRKREGVKRGRRDKVEKKIGIMPGLIGRGEVLKFTCMHKGNYTCLVLSRRVIQRGLCERRGEINFMGCCHGPERRQWRR